MLSGGLVEFIVGVNQICRVELKIIQKVEQYKKYYVHVRVELLYEHSEVSN